MHNWWCWLNQGACVHGLECSQLKHRLQIWLLTPVLYQWLWGKKIKTKFKLFSRLGKQTLGLLQSAFKTGWKALEIQHIMGLCAISHFSETQMIGGLLITTLICCEYKCIKMSYRVITIAPDRFIMKLPDCYPQKSLSYFMIIMQTGVIFVHKFLTDNKAGAVPV